MGDVALFFEEVVRPVIAREKTAFRGKITLGKAKSVVYRSKLVSAWERLWEC